MKKIVITGANGFLGKRFCELLKESGNKPLALIRNIEAAAGIKDTADISVVDFNEIDNLAGNLKNVDCVVHLISRAHILRDKYWDNDEVFCSVNVDITRNMIEACRLAGVKRFIYMSSVMAMGLLRDDILTEESECYPETAYGRSKLKAEGLVKSLCAKYNIDYCILRPPLVYGPGNKANMFRLIRLVDKGWPLPLGGVQNHRSFVYVDNVVIAALKLIDYEKVINQVFLVGDREAVSTPQLLTLIAKALNRPCRLIKVPRVFLKLLSLLDKGAVERLMGSLAVDSSKLVRFIGNFPRYPMAQGLQKTADWYLGLKRI